MFRLIHFNTVYCITTFAIDTVKTKKNLCRVDLSQDLPDNDFYPTVRKSLSGRSCERPTRHRFFLVFPATKEIGLEVNADKTKYMIMSRDQNAGRGQSMKTDNSSIGRVEEFKYLGTTLTNQNSIQEEIKSRWKLGNACYYSV